MRSMIWDYWEGEKKVNLKCQQVSNQVKSKITKKNMIISRNSIEINRKLEQLNNKDIITKES